MWQTVGTLAGVILGAAMSFWFQRVERRAAAKERWAERAAEALADVEILLTDAQPQRVTMSMNRDTVGAQVSELSARFLIFVWAVAIVIGLGNIVGIANYGVASASSASSSAWA